MIVSRDIWLIALFLTMVNNSDLRGISGSSDVRFSQTHISVSCTSLLGAGRGDETGGVGTEGFIITAEERVETFFVSGAEQTHNRTVVLHVDCLRVICHRPGYSHDSAAAGDGISL